MIASKVDVEGVKSKGQLISREPPTGHDPTIEDTWNYTIDNSSFTILDTPGIDVYRGSWPSLLERCTAIIVVFKDRSSIAVAEEILKLPHTPPAILVYYRQLSEEKGTELRGARLAEMYRCGYREVSRCGGYKAADRVFRDALKLTGAKKNWTRFLTKAYWTAKWKGFTTHPQTAETVALRRRMRP